MGIYPTNEWKVDGDVVTHIHSEPGLAITRTYTIALVDIKTVRTDCFCCSCNKYGGRDAQCRNHGFYGRRPCEEHGMPGELDPADKMPDSVQVERGKWC